MASFKYIDTNIIYTYACKNAITNSNPIVKNTTTTGKILTYENEKFNQTIIHAKDIKIFNKECPDIMFANNLIDKLKTFAIYEIISIPIKGILITVGIPSGKNNFQEPPLL
jgi:antitoxin component YwqK of YwqJK toxin-antitoxin module